jgi:hypothetical protein
MCPRYCEAQTIRANWTIQRWLTCQLDTVQDFLIKLGIKLCLHVLKISILSLNHVIVRPTKIMNKLNNILKICKNCTFKVTFQHQKPMESFWFFFSEEYLTRRSTFINEIFWKLRFIKSFFSKNVPNFCRLILVGLVMKSFCDKMLISYRCIHGLMPDLVKKSWTVSIVDLYVSYKSYLHTWQYEWSIFLIAYVCKNQSC